MMKSNRITHIVRIRQMLRRWRKKARLSAAGAPSDVPAGHVAVCVGESCRRFIVRATYLNHPIFKNLLLQAAEEYGFRNSGPLAIPCDESAFEEILNVVSASQTGNSPGRLSNLESVQRCSHDGVTGNLGYLGESRPLLRG